jgi:ABC-type transport system substrate-binding protein
LIAASGRGGRLRVVGVGLAAVGVAACGSTTSNSPSSSAAADLFNPASFNTSSVSWLTANQNAGGSPVMGGTLTMAGSTDVSSGLDPQAEYETTGFQILRATSRQLVSYASSTNIVTSDSLVPDAASSMPTVSSDGLTYTYHLRSGLMWNTTPPRAVTAQDFALGLKRICDPTIAPSGNPGYYSAEIAGFSAYCSTFEGMDPSSTPAARAAYINGNSISGVSTPDSSTIVFKLTAPSVDFNNIIALPFASAAPVEDLSYTPLTAGTSGGMPLYSDGPYAVTTYDVGHEIDMTKNASWSQSTDNIRHAYVDGIKLKVDLSGSAAESEVQQDIAAGTTDLSWNTTVPTANLAGLANPHDPRFGSFPTPGNTNPYLVFNTHSGNNGGALTKVAVRQALEYALDKVALTKIYGGPDFNQPLNQVIAPGAEGYQQINPYPTPGNQGDAAKCKQLLAAAGVTNLVLKDYYRDNGKHPSIFQEVKNDFAKCGVTVNGTPISQGYYGSKGIGVSASTTATGIAQLAQGAWDITEPGWVPDWFGNTNGRAILPDILSGNSFPGSDWGGYDNPAVDSLITQAESATSQSQAASLWHQADVKVMADAPFIPFMTQLTPLMRSTRVHNAIFLPFSDSYDITQIWLSS